MTAEELAGVINLDHLTDIKHPTSGKVVAQYSLRHVLLNLIKMNNGCPAIAEAHQQDLLMPTHLIIPNTPEAEKLVGMMNKNLPAFLFHTLKEQGLPDEFIAELLQRSCEVTMLAEMSRCKWDVTTRTLMTEDKQKQAEKTKVFESAAWFKDKFGLLGQRARNQKWYTAPEALFNLEDAGSQKTIHDRNRKAQGGTKVQVKTLPRTASKGVVDLTTNYRDSTSHTSSSSLGDLSSSNEGSHSKASSSEEDSASAAGSG
jgi:hypothetical protein